MTAVAEKGAGRPVMPATTAAAGMARVDTDIEDRASIRRENTIAIDRWEDEGGAGESPAKNSATPRSMPNQRDVGVPPPPGRDITSRTIMCAWRPLTIRRPADS